MIDPFVSIETNTLRAENDRLKERVELLEMREKMQGLEKDLDRERRYNRARNHTHEVRAVSNDGHVIHLCHKQDTRDDIVWALNQEGFTYWNCHGANHGESISWEDLRSVTFGGGK